MLTGCQRIQQLYQHDVSTVNAYTDMCQHSQQLRGHRVSIVNDYSDTDKLFYFGKSKKSKGKVTENVI